MSTPISLALQTAAPTLPTQVVQDGLLGRLLRLISDIHWPDGVSADGIKLTRVWAQRKGRVTAEHQITLRTPDGMVEFPLQGVIAPGRSAPRDDINHSVTINQGVVCGVLKIDRSESCWIATPDCDPELRALRRLFQPGALDRVVSGLSLYEHSSLPTALESASLGTPQLVRFRMGRRIVMRIPHTIEQSGGFYLKGFRRLPNPQTVNHARRLAGELFAISCGALRVPEWIGVNSKLGVAVFAEISPPASPLDYGPGDAAQAGRAIAKIHALPKLGGERIHACEDELETVARWQSALEAIRPDAPTPIAELVGRLKRRMPTAPIAAMTLIHRDFYHSQMLRNEDALWMVDWDTICFGHREQDLATYIAHAILADALAASPSADWPARIETFLDEYRASGGFFDRHRLGWHMACALTRLTAMQTARAYSCVALAPIWRLADCLADDPSACVQPGWLMEYAAPPKLGAA